MGRGKGAGRRGGGRKTGPQVDIQDMHNDRMEAYYKAQQILPEAEFEQHLAAFRRPLPTTFRVTGTQKNAIMMRDYMEQSYFPYLSNKTFDGALLKAPETIDWYPHSLAYKLDIPKQAVRKNPDFKAFQKFLVQESESGNLVRQEAVSMIPPLLMNIKSDSTCLDMCAAPGSKTSQMVEYLHAETTNPTGLVVANDSDFKRAYMLVHQVKRLNSPNFIVTNHDATFLANLHLDAEKQALKYDRILADVPCSGDGTLRKNYDVWKSWSVKSGLSLHPTQINCLRRGLQQLKVGGRLVYSTCSLNPIENEAVLHSVLSSIDGAAHLVDVSSELPALKRRPGLLTWRATDMEGNFIQSIEDVKDKHRFPKSIFPPSLEDAQRLNLDRALRIYPHLDDTGGFFVAVIDKTKEITSDFESVRFKSNKREHVESAENAEVKYKKARALETEKPEQGVSLSLEDKPVSSSAASVVDGNDTNQSIDAEVEQIIPKPKFMKSLNDEYFKFLPTDHPDLVEIKGFYGLSDDFPMDCFLSRNITGEPVRSLYYTSPIVREVLIHNEGRLKFVHAGVKVFHKQNVDNLQDGSKEAEGMCKWRIAQDGVAAIRKYVETDKFVDCTFEELTVFMQHEYPRANLFPKHDKSVIEQLKDRKYGCYIARCDLSHDASSRIPEVIEVPLWKSKVTIQMMIARKDKEAIYTRVTGKTLPPAVKIDSVVVKALQAEPLKVEEESDHLESVSKAETEVDVTAALEEEGQASLVS